LVFLLKILKCGCITVSRVKSKNTTTTKIRKINKDTRYGNLGCAFPYFNTYIILTFWKSSILSFSGEINP